MRSAFIIGRQSAVESQTLFEQTAAGLLAGSYEDLATGTGMSANGFSDDYDIQWMSICAYWDATRKELHYMGKDASTYQTSLGPGIFQHHLFDANTDTWYNPLRYELIGTGTTGHIWQTALDDETGDYYIQCRLDELARYFDRSVWESNGKQNATLSVLPSWWNNSTSQNLSLIGDGGAETVNGMAWHPNCFGSGVKGLVIAGTQSVWGWDPSGDDWYTLSSSFRDDTSAWVGANGNGGGGVYCPSGDVAVVGTGLLNTLANGPAWKVPAGSSLANRTDASYGAATSVLVVGGNGGSSGKMLQHPSNPDQLLLLVNGVNGGGVNGDVYKSDDYGVSWSDAGYDHPFANWGVSAGSYLWTAASIVGSGVIVGLKSKTGFGARMWKPAS